MTDPDRMPIADEQRFFEAFMALMQEHFDNPADAIIQLPNTVAQVVLFQAKDRACATDALIAVQLAFEETFSTAAEALEDGKASAKSFDELKEGQA